MVAGILGNFHHLVLDEIALEGLEGVTINSLWVLLGTRLNCLPPLSEPLKVAVWNCIKNSCQQIMFYELSEERETLITFNRFSNSDPNLGVPIVSDIYPVHRYKKFSPIDDNGIMGSCETYLQRKKINFDEISELTFHQILEKWGNKFIIVGTQELRLSSLIPYNVLKPTEINAHHYCYWEAIGRSRFNGETTSGSISLLQYCKDSTIMFYIKNKLIACGGVSCRLFTEIKNDRLNMTSLLTLPRFHTADRSILTVVVRKIYDLLKTTPGNVVSVSKMKQFFPNIDYVRSFKRISISHVFRALFEVRFPNENETKYLSVDDMDNNFDDEVSLTKKKRKKSKEKNNLNENNLEWKSRLVVTLRYPDCTMEEIFPNGNCLNIDGEEEEDQDSDDSQSEKHTFVDIPLKEEFYRAIWRHGRRGCSQTQLRSYLNINHLTVRQMIKGMLERKIIKYYCTDSGRQRINMYVTLDYANNVDDEKKYGNLDTLKCLENPVWPAATETCCLPADIPQILVTIEPMIYVSVNRLRKNIPLRDKIRKWIIIQSLNKQAIIVFQDILMAVQKLEKEDGYKDEMCNKSMKRLIYHLEKDKILNCYRIILSHGEHERLRIYVTHIKVTANHEIMKQEILRMKMSFFLYLEERRLRDEAAIVMQGERERKSMLKDIKLQNTPSVLWRPEVKVRQKQLRGAAAQSPPKFLISRCFHEFLYYLVVELSGYQTANHITIDILQQWQHIAPDLQINEYMQSLKDDENILIYQSQDLNWRTFIPPLPLYADKPAGWIYMQDVLERIPLSIFNKIFRQNKEIDTDLAYYLMHPVRQHYLMRQLPIELQLLISHAYQQQIYSSILKLLNVMGLLQVKYIASQPKDPLSIWVYLNRNVIIKDTTTSKENYDQIETEQEYDILTYKLNTFTDVNQYWTSLHRVCVYTKLGFRTEGRQLIGKRKREKDLEYMPNVEFDEAPNQDVGYIPGDGLGAAGLSSKLYAHLFRNWSWVTTATSSVGKPIHRNQLRNSPAWQPLRKNRQHIMKSSSLAPTSSNSKKIQRTHIKRTQTGLLKRALKHGPRDNIDRDALKNMRTLRGKWQREEDFILKLARAVYLYLAPPISLLGLIAVGKITRDIIRHHLGVCNKTTQSCVRRLQFIVRMRRHVPQVPTWLNMLQTNVQLQRIYGVSFLHDLKKIYNVKQELIIALEKHFLYIMHLLYQWVNIDDVKTSTSTTTINHKHLLPNTKEEFNKLFNVRSITINSTCIVATTTNKKNSNTRQAREHTSSEKDAQEGNLITNSDNQYQVWNKHANPKTTTDLQIIQVICVLHSLLCCARDKTVFNMQAFEIFKHYSEEVLQAAFAKARADALVIPMRRKNLTLKPLQLAAPTYTLSNKYRMRLMYLKMPYAIYDMCYAIFRHFIRNNYLISNDNAQISNSCKIRRIKTTKVNENSAQNDYFELKSPTSGQLLFLAEGLCNQLMQVDINLPTNILTVDAEQSQNVHSFDRILNQHHSIFDHAPRTEYAKNLEIVQIGEKKKRVQFNRANLSYKIYYSPWDYISKMHTYKLHFFCALDAIYQEVEINFMRLITCDYNEMEKDDENISTDVDRKSAEKRIESIYLKHISLPVCPFRGCIMHKSSYLNEIERIVRERHALLNKLKIEKSSSEQIILVEGTTKIKVQPTNIFSLTRMLETFWADKIQNVERKDIGKMSKQKKNINNDIKKSLTTTASLKKDNQNIEEDFVSETVWLQLCNEINEDNVNVDDYDKIDEHEPTLNKQDHVARVQDVFVINLPTLKLLAKEHKYIDLNSFQRETEAHRDKILQKVLSESLWKYTDNSFGTIMQKLDAIGFNTMEKQHLQAIHDFIESKSFGVSASELIHKFPYEKFLLRALNVLIENWLIKRVGVAAQLYVHKSNIRPWVVHTFHVKRLERESLISKENPSTSKTRQESAIEQTLKRTHNMAFEKKKKEISTRNLNEDQIKNNNSRENSDTEIDSPIRKKQQIHPENKSDLQSTSSNANFTARELIVMRPQPWMRLNGSINRRVLDRWLGSIVIECINRNGMCLLDVCNRFPHLIPVDVMFLLELLVDLKCVRLKENSSRKVLTTLTSAYEPNAEKDVTIICDPARTYVFVENYAITRVAQFIGQKKYSTDFI